MEKKQRPDAKPKRPMWLELPDDGFYSATIKRSGRPATEMRCCSAVRVGQNDTPRAGPERGALTRQRAWPPRLRHGLPF